MNADELRMAINHAITAHADYPKRGDKAFRLWDNRTPYVVHPIWCATMLLTETTLPEHVRAMGYLALLYHDILEDTNLPLPEGAPDEVSRLVEDMTFESLGDEIASIWACSDTVKLLKLYDKVSNLLDGSWMPAEKWNKYVEHTLRIAQFVAAEYGPLNIVKIAQVICVRKEVSVDHDC